MISLRFQIMLLGRIGVTIEWGMDPCRAVSVVSRRGKVVSIVRVSMGNYGRHDDILLFKNTLASTKQLSPCPSIVEHPDAYTFTFF